MSLRFIFMQHRSTHYGLSLHCKGPVPYKIHLMEHAKKCRLISFEGSIRFFFGDTETRRSKTL